AHYRAVERRARVEPGGRLARRAQYDVQAAMQTRATSLRCASVACVGLRQWSGPTSGREIAIPRESIGNSAWVYGLVRDEVVRRHRILYGAGNERQRVRTNIFAVAPARRSLRWRRDPRRTTRGFSRNGLRMAVGFRNRAAQRQGTSEVPAVHVSGRRFVAGFVAQTVGGVCAGVVRGGFGGALALDGDGRYDAARTNCGQGHGEFPAYFFPRRRRISQSRGNFGPVFALSARNLVIRTDTPYFGE